MVDDELPDWASTVFWALVLVFNVALFATAVGLMVLYFEGDRLLGGSLVSAGLIAWVVGLVGYRWSRRRLET